MMDVVVEFEMVQRFERSWTSHFIVFGGVGRNKQSDNAETMGAPSPNRPLKIESNVNLIQLKMRGQRAKNVSSSASHSSIHIQCM